MAPQRKNDDDDDHEYPLTSTTKDDDYEPTISPFPWKPVVMPSPIVSSESPEITDGEYTYTGYYKPHPTPPWVTNSNIPKPGPPLATSSSNWITTTKDSAEWESQYESRTSTSPIRLGSAPPTSSDLGHRPGWTDKGRDSNVGFVVGAVIGPIAALTVIGMLVFFCMRKRKRRAQSAAAQQRVQEMKMQPQPQSTVQPYMAPPSGPSPQYSPTDSHPLPLSSPVVPHPVILGPIPSGSNGAYFTGIDTSDVVSMTSASHLRPTPVNPFNDNESLVEPPPPYRPRSAAPPSLTNSSRQSSLRASIAPPTTSRTHLIERSPFDDPVEDDAISDLSGPTAGRYEENMSAVSDLSYQQDPVVNRPSL
ncbi:hypothetical protein EK21DRAFT_85790 [Setomelanomma holmii]|uniref:Uncharacterized protein n=1 Tax=Setomelanomma holmii TaxID=210430 RepID=A0A9P4HI40_9PLEO|nr:hypothetical protein EK21DRAFT_85790 [Setomelanomma holmii]